MAFTLGKRLTAYPPRPQPDAGGQPALAGGLAKAGSVLTANSGIWNGQGGNNFAYQWWLGTRTAYASATNASYSISAGDAGSGLSCVINCGNATWGTTQRQIAAVGTILP